jgi:hypothetical protein
MRDHARGRGRCNRRRYHQRHWHIGQGDLQHLVDLGQILDVLIRDQHRGDAASNRGNAVQITQVLLRQPRRPIVVAKIQVYVKSKLELTPLTEIPGLPTPLVTFVRYGPGGSLGFRANAPRWWPPLPSRQREVVASGASARPRRADDETLLGEIREMAGCGDLGGAGKRQVLARC